MFLTIGTILLAVMVVLLSIRVLHQHRENQVLAVRLFEEIEQHGKNMYLVDTLLEIHEGERRDYDATNHELMVNLGQVTSLYLTELQEHAYTQQMLDLLWARTTVLFDTTVTSQKRQLLSQPKAKAKR